MFGAANALREQISAPLPPAETEKYESGLDLCRAGLSGESFDHAWATGRALGLEDATGLARRVARAITAAEPPPSA